MRITTNTMSFTLEQRVQRACALSAVLAVTGTVGVLAMALVRCAQKRIPVLVWLLFGLWAIVLSDLYEQVVQTIKETEDTRPVAGSEPATATEPELATEPEVTPTRRRPRSRSGSRSGLRSKSRAVTDESDLGLCLMIAVLYMLGQS